MEAEYTSKAWVKFEHVAALKHPSIKIIQGTVSLVDCGEKVAQITRSDSVECSIQYDFFLAASGLRRVWPTVPQSLTRKDYLHECQAHIDSVKEAKEGVAVIGGGESTKLKLETRV